MPHVVAIDLGSSGLKVAVVDERGRVAGRAMEPVHTTFLPGGGAEQDPGEWWSALGRASRAALADGAVAGGDVVAVVVTAQYMSIVPVAADGSPVGNVVMWMDARGARHHRSVPDTERDTWIERHGLVPGGYDDHAHIALLRAEFPDVYEAAAAFVEPVDYLTARLCGRVVATQTTAFPLIAIDNRIHGTLTYDDDLLACAELDVGKLPALVPHDEPLGPITAAAAAHLGISTGAVVVPGTIDSITSGVGCGAIDRSSCSVVIGTTSVVVTHVDAKAVDPEHGIISVPSPVDRRYFVMAENGIGGKALEYFLNNVVYADDELSTAPIPPDAFARVEAVASSARGGRGAPMCLPWLVGSMAPQPNGVVRGGFVNIGLTTSRADLARAVYEGVALNAAWLVPHVAAFAGSEWSEITFGGGGAASALWGQLLADALGLAVVQLADPGSTNARGAAFLALAMLGYIALDDIKSLLVVARTVEPDDKARAIARDRLEQFVAFHQLVQPFYAGLRGRPA